jgi:hypothetical protein
VKDEAALKGFSWNDRENIRDAQVAFVTEYEAAALGSPDPEWQGKDQRSIQSIVDEKFSLAALALWLVKPSPLTCEPVLHFDEKGDPESLRTASKLRSILIQEDENLNVIDAQDLEEAGKLFVEILSLKRQGPVWIALRFLTRAVSETMWEARYLWQWVVLEALFGPESPGETKYRIALRISQFLGGDRGAQLETFRDAYSPNPD